MVAVVATFILGIFKGRWYWLVLIIAIGTGWSIMFAGRPAWYMSGGHLTNAPDYGRIVAMDALVYAVAYGLGYGIRAVVDLIRAGRTKAG